MSRVGLLLGSGLAVLLSSFLVGLYLSKNDLAKQLDNSKVKVVTSFYPLSFITQQIGGEKTSVFNITPAGAEPHDYEPTSGDLARIERSQLVIINGQVESWGEKVKNNLKGSEIRFLEVGQGLFTEKLAENNNFIPDPHIWLDPKRAQQMVVKITSALEELDQQNAAYYQSNSAKLLAKLEALDQAYRTGLGNCQENNIITSHAAFGYLATEYGFNQISITGLSPDSEPSNKQLAQITQFAKDNQVKYIFFEALVSPKLAQALAGEVGAQTLVLNPLEGLTNQEIKDGQDYFTVMRFNLTNLKVALQCR